MSRRESPFALAVLVACIAAAGLLPRPALPQPDVAALVQQMPDADRDGKYTGPSPGDAERVYQAIFNGGRNSILQLIGMIVEPGAGDDYKARYVLHGLAIYVGRPGLETERRVAGDALISALTGDTSPGVKRCLIQELQFLGETRSAEAIGSFLLDEALCDDAAMALVALGQEAAGPLAKALPDAQGRSRLAVIQALGELRHAASADALVPLLQDEDSDCRVAAAVALGKIGAARGARPMIRALEVAEGYDRVQIFEACCVLADNLRQAVRSQSARRFYSGIWRATPGQGEPQVRHAVAQALAAESGAQPTEALVQALQANDPAVRAAAVYALGQRGDETAFPAVAAAMRDEDAGVRLVAISSVGPTGQEQSVPVLVAALPGEEPQGTRALWSALLTVPGAEANAALAQGLAGVPDGPDSALSRRVLLSVLTERRAAEGADPAFELATDEDAAVRVQALRALAVIADGTYAPRLTQLVARPRDGEESKAFEDALVATCLRISDEARRVEPLLPVLASAESGPRCVLLRVVGRIGAPASVSVLLEALSDGNAEVRDTAMRALSEFPNDRPAPQLLEIAKTTDNADHHVLALRGYVRMAEQQRANEDKCAMLKDAMGAAVGLDERRLVLDSMGKINSAEALTAVASWLTEPGLTERAGRAAVRIARELKAPDADTVRQAMQAVLQHVRTEEVRKDATDVLAGL